MLSEDQFDLRRSGDAAEFALGVDQGNQGRANQVKVNLFPLISFRRGFRILLFHLLTFSVSQLLAYSLSDLIILNLSFFVNRYFGTMPIYPMVFTCSVTYYIMKSSYSQ